jgi:hypothetical protein
MKHEMKHEMKYLLATLIFSVLPMRAATFQVEGGANALAWGKILGSVGIERANSNSYIVVEGAAAREDSARLALAHILILQGDSPAGRSLGILPQKERVTVRQIVDKHGPQMQIIWEQAAEIAKTQLPEGFSVYATERWKGVPVLAGKRTENGAVLWMATEPGLSGIERYPYLLQALVDLGFGLAAACDKFVGVLRFVLPDSCGCGLSGETLAGSGRERAARGGVAQHGT